MAAIAAQRGVSAEAFAKAFAAANAGMTPEMVQVRANRRGWLEEIWICLDKG
jgi:ribonuclease T2